MLITFDNFKETDNLFHCCFYDLFTLGLITWSMSGNYVKVLYDFATTESSDLSLEVNDVVKIIDVIDDDWLSGMCNGRLGNFPQNYVEAINLPSIQSEERIFVAIKNFPAEMHEDLALTKGIRH